MNLNHFIGTNEMQTCKCIWDKIDMDEIHHMECHGQWWLLNNMDLIYDLHDIDYICDMGARGALDDMNEIDYMVTSHDMNDIDTWDIIMYSIGTHGWKYEVKIDNKWDKWHGGNRTIWITQIKP